VSARSLKPEGLLWDICSAAFMHAQVTVPVIKTITTSLLAAAAPRREH